MSTPVQLKITKVGMEAVFDAENRGLSLELDRMVYSSANFESETLDPRTTIPNVVYESAIAVGGMSEDRKTMRFFTTITAPAETRFGSVGVYTKQGVLFAVASVPTGDLFKVYGGVSFIASFGLSLSPTVSSMISIVTDEQGALALLTMLNHESAENPHPQYKAMIDAITLDLTTTKDRVDTLESSIGSLEGQGFVKADKFWLRTETVGANWTIYPTYHVVQFTAQTMPKGYLKQVMEIIGYYKDLLVYVILPFYVPPSRIFNVQAHIKSAVYIDDTSGRLWNVTTELLNGRLVTVVHVMFDRTSGGSKYNGQSTMYLEVESWYPDRPYTMYQTGSYPYPQVLPPSGIAPDV